MVGEATVIAIAIVTVIIVDFFLFDEMVTRAVVVSSHTIHSCMLVAVVVFIDVDVAVAVVVAVVAPSRSLSLPSFLPLLAHSLEPIPPHTLPQHHACGITKADINMVIVIMRMQYAQGGRSIMINNIHSHVD